MPQLWSRLRSGGEILQQLRDPAESEGVLRELRSGTGSGSNVLQQLRDEERIMDYEKSKCIMDDFIFDLSYCF